MYLKSTYNYRDPIQYALDRLQYLRIVLNKDMEIEAKIKQIDILQNEIVEAMKQPFRPDKHILRYPVDKPTQIEANIRLVERCIVNNDLPIGQRRGRVIDLLCRVKYELRKQLENKDKEA